MILVRPRTPTYTLALKCREQEQARRGKSAEPNDSVFRTPPEHAQCASASNSAATISSSIAQLLRAGTSHQHAPIDRASQAFFLENAEGTAGKS